MAVVPAQNPGSPSNDEVVQQLIFDDDLVDTALKELFGDNLNDNQRLCGACGAKNVKKYYGALACNSCRAFFARYCTVQRQCLQ